MMAREASSLLAKDLALSTPPASGETITRSFEFAFFQVFVQHRSCVQMIDRDIEKALYLTGMKVYSQDAVCPSRGEQVGNEFRRNRHSRLHLPILACITVIGYYSGYPACRCPLKGVDDKEQFHDIIVYRGTGGLYHKDIRTPHIIIDLDHKFAVAESSHGGIPLTDTTVTTFSDGELMVQINDNVRGSDVFVIQSTCTPINNNIMELLLIIDALKRASASRITAVIPYYGYARQDRKVQPRVPISSKLVADLLTAAGTNRVLTIDLHAGQIQGFFNIPVDHLYAAPVCTNT